jgi:hypothetical protein
VANLGKYDLRNIFPSCSPIRRSAPAIFVILSLLGNPVSAAPVNQSEFGELFKACFSYYTAARVCGDPAVTMQAEKNLRRALNWGEFKGILSKEAKIYLVDPAIFIRKGEEHYRRDRYVGCEQVGQAVHILDGVTRSLP